MGTITLPYTFVAGQTPTATNWNANPTTIATLVNGQIDKANVDSSAQTALLLWMRHRQLAVPRLSLVR